MKAIISTDIRQAKKILEYSEVVAIPTETVYGLAANALDRDAVLRIFSAKDRPLFDPLIVHVADFADLFLYASEFPEKAQILARKFMPGPFTLVLPKKSIIPDLTTSGLDRVGLRIPRHPLTRKLLQSLSFPLAAPSANPFGYVSPTSAQHVFDQLGLRIPFILDGGPCKVGIESTILGFEDGEAVVYRTGGVPVEEIEKLIGKVRLEVNMSSDPKSPGMLKNHYAPKIKLIFDRPDLHLKNYNPERTGIISLNKIYNNIPAENHVLLSEEGDLEEAARNLFAAIRKMDNMDIDVILAEIFPDKSFGVAINDRLKRAAAK